MLNTLYPVPYTIKLAPMRTTYLLLTIFALFCNSSFAQDTTALQAKDSIRVQLHGTVIDEITQEPLYETLVEWYDSAGKRQAVTQTNNEGRYALFVWAGEDVELRIVENGYQDYAEVLPGFKAGESAREHVIRMVPK